MKSDFVASCSNFVARLTPALSDSRDIFACDGFLRNKEELTRGE
jgi:hypothetical protein